MPGTNQRFQEQRQERSDARLAETLQQIPGDIAAGESYHQVASLDSGPIRTRSSKSPVSEGALWNNDGNAFGPRVATILHSQMLARGMEGAELVHPVELSAMGHQKLEEKRMEAPLVAVRAGALGLTTDPDVVSGVVVRPSSSYDLLHVESQTSLRAVPKRLMDGRTPDERSAIHSTLSELVSRSGVQLKTHAGDRIAITAGSKGPQVAHPAREKFGSPAEYARSVMRAVSTAVARSEGLSAHVQDEEIGRRAVASVRRRERRQIPAGGTRYAEVRSQAVAQLANRGVKELAAREQVYLATDQPRDEAHFDKETRTFYPERKPARAAGPDTREQRFNERMLLAARPRFHLHFTPTYSSWLNQVERWFGLLSQRAIKRGSFRSVPDQGPGQLHGRRGQCGEPDQRSDRSGRGGAGAADGELQRRAERAHG